MNEKIDVNVKTLTPFTKILMTIGELPTSYLMSMTYYEQLIWFTKYLQEQVIPAINTNAEAVQELQNLFIELQEYVNTYFDNLDVQEEINNKLDEMAENGQLEELIADYLQTKAIYGFDNVSEMLSSDDLVNGSYAKTLGYYSANDGGGATYKITNDENLVVDNLFVLELTNGLKAQIIVENKILNALQFGAKNDNTTDVGTILNGLMNSSYTSIFLPEGQYRLESVLYVKDNKSIFGSLNKSQLNITATGQLKAGEYSQHYQYIELRNLVIRCNGDRTGNGYAVYFENCSLCKIQECIIRSDNATSVLNGVHFEKTNNSLQCYDNKIINNQFQRNSLSLRNSTDNFIDNNIIWGNNITDTSSLFLDGKCDNTSITNNHFVAASYGCIKVDDTCNQLRITNNYFDNVGIGINIVTVYEANISDNIFYNQDQAMLIDAIIMSTVNNNTFKNCDINDQGYPDIKITGGFGGNTFSGNKHYRTSEKTHTNKGLAYDIPEGTSGYPHNVINMSTVMYGAYYNAVDTTQFTRNHFVNCYPADLFTT